MSNECFGGGLPSVPIYMCVSSTLTFIDRHKQDITGERSMQSFPLSLSVVFDKEQRQHSVLVLQALLVSRILFYPWNVNLSCHMSVIRPFDPTDILRFNNINADPWTATVGLLCPSNMNVLTPLTKYHNGYYASYTAQWPDWCVAVEGAYDPKLKAYSEHGGFIMRTII